LADGRRQRGEEVEAQAREPARHDQPQHGDERDEREDQPEPAQAGHDPVHRTAAGARLHAATRAGPRVAMRTRMRAAMLRTKVTAKRRRPNAAMAMLVMVGRIMMARMMPAAR